MHGLVPVAQELLVDVVRVKERYTFEPIEQVITEGSDKFVRLGIGGDGLECGAVVLEPLSHHVADTCREGLELGRVEDLPLHLVHADVEVDVAGSVRPEQLRAEAGEGVPVASECIDVPLRDTAMQVSVE
ncbi:MAG: hypothetical protein KC561_14400, partial [Myxococcales bacterium]|nr:hypothetical protein [Myxococcales bacterium]